jgi:hypothetical protein
MKLQKQLLHKPTKYFVLFVYLIIIVNSAKGQNKVITMENTECNIKAMIFDKDKEFFIDYLFSVDSIYTDQFLLEKKQKKINNLSGETSNMIINSYRLVNDSIIDIGITDSTVYIDISGKNFTINLKPNTIITFLGYQINPNVIEPIFSIKNENCIVYFGIIYKKGVKKVRITQYDIITKY